MTKSVFTAFLSAFLTLALGTGISHAGDDKKAAKAEKKEGAAAAVPAAAGKEVTLKGEMTCGKCGLKETSKCQNVLNATEGGKEVKYYLVENPVAKDGHSKVCGGSAPATVTGTVADEGGKKMLTASAIKY